MRLYVRLAPRHAGGARLVRWVQGWDGADTGPFLTEPNPGVWMQLDLGSHIDRRIYYHGFYRPWIVPVFDRLLDGARTYVDVGANTGHYALYAASRMGPEGRVWAFEPEASCYERAVENAALNPELRVDFMRAAVADVVGELLLHVGSDSAANRGQSSIAHLTMHESAQRVPATTLDQAAAEGSWGKVDVLKIDTQGAELKVLKGGEKLISTHRPAILLRCHEEKCAALGDSTREIQDWLIDAGYSIHRVDRGGRSHPVTSPTVFEDVTLLAQPEPRG